MQSLGRLRYGPESPAPPNSYPDDNRSQTDYLCLGQSEKEWRIDAYELDGESEDTAQDQVDGEYRSRPGIAPGNSHEQPE